MQIAVLGIDLGKNSCSVAALDSTDRCRRSQSSVLVLANRADSCLNYLTIGRRSCSHYLPACSPSSRRARQRRLVLTFRANGNSSVRGGPAVLENQAIWNGLQGECTGVRVLADDCERLHPGSGSL